MSRGRAGTFHTTYIVSPESSDLLNVADIQRVVVRLRTGHVERARATPATTIVLNTLDIAVDRTCYVSPL